MDYHDERGQEEDLIVLDCVVGIIQRRSRKDHGGER